MKPILSSHAHQRLVERNIRIEVVEETISTPDSCNFEDGLMICQKLWNQDGSLFLIRVYVNENKVPPMIVTVYKTSKISKYK